mgnify:CR=1 FL=1
MKNSKSSRDLRHLAEHLLYTDADSLSAREIRYLMRISHRLQTIRGNKLEDSGELKFGERLADKVAEFGGSWTFIIYFALFLLTWSVINVVVLHNQGFDPYPFVFLNLILSMLAAIQAPVIMMSQNRQANRDRMTMMRDFDVNLKTELSISELHKHLDHLTWQTLQTQHDIQRTQQQILQLLETHRPNAAQENRHTDSAPPAN